MSEATPELSRPIKLRHIPNDPVVVEADEAERAALAIRFGVVAIECLRAEVTLDPEGRKIDAEGSLEADIVQTCAVSGEDFPVRIDEDFALVFVPLAERQPADDEIEIELEREELDEVEYCGDSFDLGEAVAQGLALAIDPYAEGPNADAVRKEHGLDSDDTSKGPLAEALAGLTKN